MDNRKPPIPSIATLTAEYIGFTMAQMSFARFGHIGGGEYAVGVQLITDAFPDSARLPLEIGVHTGIKTCSELTKEQGKPILAWELLDFLRRNHKK